MKKVIVLVFGSYLVVFLIAASPAAASDPIAKKILAKYFAKKIEAELKNVQDEQASTQ